MKKILIILSIIAAFIVVFVFIRPYEFHFNYSSDIYSIEFKFISDRGQLESKVVTDRNTIYNVIEFLNSLTLAKSSVRPRDAVNHVDFKDEKGKTVYSFQFGKSGVLWIGSRTYEFGNSNISKLEELLNKS